jgi:hypothetical protein
MWMNKRGNEHWRMIWTSPNNHMPNGKNSVKQSDESDEFVANWAKGSVSKWSEQDLGICIKAWKHV